MDELDAHAMGKVDFNENELGALMYRNAPDPMFLFQVGPDQDHQCVSVNRAYLDRMGLAAADVIGKRIEQVLPESKAAVALEKYLQVVQGREPVRYEADANELSIAQTTLTPILDAAGRCIYVLGVERDITEFKRAETVERERRIFAETLHDISTALKPTLELEQVLDQILSQVGRIVTHDAANILLLESDNSIGFARGRGYETRGWLNETQCVNVEQVALLQRMLASHSAMVVSDVREGEEWNSRLSGMESIRAWVGAPLVTGGHVIGFLNLDSAVPGHFGSTDAERLQMFADQMALVIENARLRAQVSGLTIVDELTGLYNRRGLFQFGEYEFSRALHNKHVLAAIKLDVDCFERVNDTFGRPMGDAVLQQLAQCCRQHVRDIDIVARYDGEEFVVLLPETDATFAKRIADRLRNLIQITPFVVSATQPEGMIHITVSIGVAGGYPWNQKLTTLLERADHALKLAQSLGSSQVVLN